MSSHTWFSECPHCRFEKMIVSSNGSLYIEVSCPICGYLLWTEEKVPDNHDIELAKHKITKMDIKETDKAVEQFYEDNIPLISRSKARLKRC